MNRWHLTVAIPPVLATATQRPSNATKAPKLSDGQKLTDIMPFTVVHAIGGIRPIGGFANGYSMYELDYQIDAVGANEEQAETLLQRARTFMTTQWPLITSPKMQTDPLKVVGVAISAGSQPQPTPDDSLVSISERYTITVSEG